MGGKNTKRAAQRVVPDDLESVVREALAAQPGLKATAAAMKSVLPVSHRDFAKEAQTLLLGLAERGQIHAYRKGKATLHFAREPMGEVESAALKALTGGALGKDALRQAVFKAAPGFEILLDDWVKQALSRGILFSHPKLPGSKEARFGREPELGVSLGPALTALRKALVKTDAQKVPRALVAEWLLQELHLPEERRGGATPAVEGNGHSANGGSHSQQRTAFLTALGALAAEHPRQALLSVKDLRARLPFPKEQFDGLALELMQAGAISLHHHDHATALAEADREALVRDSRGNHFIGIAQKRGT
jgi:hypothetical protein